MPFLGRSPDIGAISDNIVTSAKIVNATIVAADLADDAVTTGKITDLNVTTAKIANDAITAAKIADSVSLGAYNGWAVKTGAYNAQNKDQLIANSGSNFTITLPAASVSGGNQGNTVIICNAGAGTVTVARNSSNINSAAEDGTIAQGASAQLVYVDDTIGWFEI
tara:strand:- start:128 stop:622 length:495 start_codon:yes stop_codon:yes gene_type:complete